MLIFIFCFDAFVVAKVQKYSNFYETFRELSDNLMIISTSPYSFFIPAAVGIKKRRNVRVSAKSERVLARISMEI